MATICSGLVQIITGEREPVPIPLISVDVVASVVHAVGRVEVCQVFVNKEKYPVETTYYFPVSPEEVVTHFQAELEGRIIKAIVKDNEDGNGASMVNYHNVTSFWGEVQSDLFKVGVGLLNPEEQVKVVIGYVTELKYESELNAMTFTIPTTIVPRFVSPTEPTLTADDYMKMRLSKPIPVPLSLRVNICLQGGIWSVESPTHIVSVDKSGRYPQNPKWAKATVEMIGRVADMGRDFVINIVPEEVYKPRLYSEKREDGSTAVILHLIPSFKRDEQKSELIFVLDRSRSMEGQSMESARKALLIFLHSIPTDSYFNVVGFGSKYNFLFPTSVKYNETSLLEAVYHANSLQADMGGTNILEPLKAIYASKKIEGYLRQIFILTDGEVSNTDGVIGIVHENAFRARVFALGIGDGASQTLVEGVAKAGGGTSAFVAYGESFERKLMNQLKAALHPSLTDIQLEWQGLLSAQVVEVNRTDAWLESNNSPIKSGDGIQPARKPHKQYPLRIPPSFAGSQMLVFALFEGECPTAVKMKAGSPDGPITLKMELSGKNDIGSVNMLHPWTAVMLIRELEQQVASRHFRQGPNVTRDTKPLNQEIIELSCKNGITSTHTSFVAVDGDSKPLSENWVIECKDEPPKSGHGWIVGSSGRHRIRSCGKPRNMGPTPLALITLQSFHGSFTLTAELSAIVGSPLQALKSGARKNHVDEQSFATALAIVYFEKKMTPEKEIWELVVRKSRQWLSQRMHTGDRMDFILVAASRFIFGKRPMSSIGDGETSEGNVFRDYEIGITTSFIMTTR